MSNELIIYQIVSDIKLSSKMDYTKAEIVGLLLKYIEEKCK